MKNIYIYIATLVFTTSFFGQVGIGTEEPYENSSIDAYSTEKGMLVPRVPLTDIYDVVTIANPAKGLYVFNTIDSGTFPNNVERNNFYYWDGVKWTQLVSGPKFRKVLDELNIPKLAGYWYKKVAEKFDDPVGISVVTYDTNDPLSYYYKFTEYIDYNLSDPTHTSFIIKKTGLYGIEGFSCILMNISNTVINEPLFLETVIQKSTDNGVTWEDTPLIATVPYQKSMTTGLTVPTYVTGVIQFNQNDLIRIGARLNFLTGSPANYSFVDYLTFNRSDALGVKYDAGFKAIYYP